MVEEDFSKKIQDYLNKKGLVIPKRPRDAEGNNINPVLPCDLTILDDEALGRLYSEFSQMAVYCILQLSVKSVEKMFKDHDDRLTRCKARLEKEGTVADKDALVEIDVNVRETTEAKLVTEATEALTDAFMKGYISGREACSREVSRRQRVFDGKRM